MAHKKGFIHMVGSTPIIPISVKILAVFTCLLLLSNFTTNFINLRMNQAQIIRLTNTILVKQLKDIYTNAANQNEIYKFSRNYEEAVAAIAAGAEKGFESSGSLALGVKKDGTLLFQAGGTGTLTDFPDKSALEKLNKELSDGIEEGSMYFTGTAGSYLSVYKYQNNWDCFLIRAETVKDMYSASNIIFRNISIIIVALTLAFLGLGLVLFSRILRFIRKITENLYNMTENQNLELLDLEGASNDDITFLGMSFNQLSSTINNLLVIFRKFVSQDVVQKAYSEHTIRLEGSQKDLTVLFTDIRGFTYMTETLGNDIISLLNIHYDRAIRKIHNENGIIGSIIGDALLAVYGTVGSLRNKSLEALRSAWGIIEVTEKLRNIMIERREQIEKTRVLTENEERIFKAVLIDVGVGIDGGKVFYGNIGSLERMTNTVIGDNVNSASRLEGLTRIYRVPVIISEHVKNEISTVSGDYVFFELDTVQVKGKTEGLKIFLPLEKSKQDEAALQNYTLFSEGLVEYYAGNWAEAKKKMKVCSLDCTEVFLERMSIKLPENWNGIWTMQTK